jgi:transcription initiation factor IIF auxiliary subunit
MLDKLRVCVICNYYSLNGKLNLNEYIDHPVISSLKCEHLEMAIQQGLSEKMSMVNEVLAKQQTNRSNSIDSSVQLHNLKRCEDEESSMNKLHQLERQIIMENYQQFNVKLFVGNVSKSLNTSTSNAASRTEQILLLNEQGETVIESSQYNQELITHKWMIYIRSPNCAKLSNYIRKVIFYLHFSYKPYDVVEVRNAPFQLIRRGWGEFPVHVQIHFKDPRNKRVDINHQLKLDWTQTGLQTFGGETSQDVCMYIKRNDFISANQTNSNLAATTTTTSTSTTSHEPENTGINEQTNLNETEQERFDYYTQPQIDQQIDQQQDQLSQSLQEEYTFNAQSERRVEEESEYRNGENFINTVFDSDSSSSFGVTSILMPTNSIQSDTNTFDGRMSPSNFISTDVQHEKEQQQSIQNNQVRPEQLEARTNSIGFDELMRNICSNANVSNQTVTQTANTIAESAIIKLKPNDVTNNNATTTRIETSKLKTNLDDLLNLRPKSLSSGPQSKLPLTLIKSVLPIKTVSHSSMSTAALPITQNAHSIQLNKTHESRIVSENYLDDKKVVIYKVDSSDLSNKTSSSILNLSTNKHTNAHVLTNYSSFNHNIDCGVSELMHRKSALPSAQFDNNCEQTLTPLATTSTKKIKLTSDQLTKIKRVEQQSQIDFNHHQESKTAFNHSNQSEPMNLMKNENEDHLLMREAIANEQQIEFQEAPLVNMFDEQQKYIYTVERLIEQLKISNQNDELQNKLFNFEYFLRIAHKYCPIVCHKPTDERHKAIKSAKVNYLFCANSIHEFYTWPYAKRKANEWLRALYIKRKYQQLISFHKSNVNIELWSTKAIVLWLRSHGFTPLEYKHMFANQHQYNQYSSQEHLELNRYVNSFSSVNELIKLDKHEQNLSEGLRQKKSNHEEDDDENIDIVNNYEEKAKPKNYLIKKMEYLAEEQHTETCEVDSIEMCLGSKFVREQLDLVTHSFSF